VEKVFDLGFLDKPNYDEMIDVLEDEAKCLAPRQKGSSKKYSSSTTLAQSSSGF